MSRIICDAYYKEKKLFGDNVQDEFNQRISAVNQMYGWLYEKGILEKVCFEFHVFSNGVCFAFDTKDLEPYREEMAKSGFLGSVVAIRHIFDEPYSPCHYSGVIQPGWTMATYRDVDGIVDRSWECDLIKGLNTETIYAINKVKEERGIREAVKSLFSCYVWPEPEKKRSVDEQIHHAENKSLNRPADNAPNHCQPEQGR